MFRTPYLSNAAQPLPIVQNSIPTNKREKICNSFWYSLLLNISKHTMCFVAESEKDNQVKRFQTLKLVQLKRFESGKKSFIVEENILNFTTKTRKPVGPYVNCWSGLSSLNLVSTVKNLFSLNKNKIRFQNFTLKIY